MAAEFGTLSHSTPLGQRCKIFHERRHLGYILVMFFHPRKRQSRYPLKDNGLCLLKNGGDGAIIELTARLGPEPHRFRHSARP